MCKVSVIIPVYNIEEYIEDCIHSLIHQTLEDCEFIFVNDGSTDRSRTILSKYQKLDERIKVVDKPNEGIATVRPLGVKHANGKYIFFLDGDDYLHNNALLNLYQCAVSSNVDIVAGSHSRIRNGTVEGYFDWGEEGIVSTSAFIKRSIELNNFYIWGKLFKSKLLVHDYYYGRSSYGEDGVLLMQIALLSNNCFIFNKNIYYYRLRPLSLTNLDTEKSYIDRYESSVFIRSFIKSQVTDKEILKCADLYYLFQVFKTIYDCPKAFLNREDSHEVLKDIEHLDIYKSQLVDKDFYAYYVLKQYSIGDPNLKYKLFVIRLFRRAKRGLKKINRVMKHATKK
ncbi:glycosyltransferase family 2 protein [Pluralibacter gergoviae]|uniref:glycosyltransferase family 2 protein n=1 Tax=Pluralibacter gergoviae TaxID=61647 RepID=UPI002853B46D|nr:glycosyltransferase family 2 protein [Pluralibacter gergoviae]